MARSWTGGSASSLWRPWPGFAIVGLVGNAAREKVEMTTEKAAVEAVLESYIDACRRGDVELLKEIFHPDAAMNGYLAGSLLVGGPGPFFDAVAGNPSPAETGAAYSAVVEDVVIDGRQATGIIREQGFLGMDFSNHFQLLEIDGSWRIVAKLFESH